jgi:hypothetical protein
MSSPGSHRLVSGIPTRAPFTRILDERLTESRQGLT